LGKGGLACAAPFPKSCAQIWAQDSGCSFYNRSNQQNFKNEKFIVDYHMPPRHAARLLIRPAGPAAGRYFRVEGRQFLMVKNGFAVVKNLLRSL